MKSGVTKYLISDHQRDCWIIIYSNSGFQLLFHRLKSAPVKPLTGNQPDIVSLFQSFINQKYKTFSRSSFSNVFCGSYLLVIVSVWTLNTWSWVFCCIFWHFIDPNINWLFNNTIRGWRCCESSAAEQVTTVRDLASSFNQQNQIFFVRLCGTFSRHLCRYCFFFVLTRTKWFFVL